MTKRNVSKEEMLNYICGETPIDLASSPYDGLLWDIYTLRAEIDERINKIENTIWILKRKENGK
tara:strand:+ start:12360 stop:12551 length:192 start_codon:yes stop_codon:yes gene_type:complete